MIVWGCLNWSLAISIFFDSFNPMHSCLAPSNNFGGGENHQKNIKKTSKIMIFASKCVQNQKKNAQNTYFECSDHLKKFCGARGAGLGQENRKKSIFRFSRFFSSTHTILMIWKSMILHRKIWKKRIFFLKIAWKTFFEFCKLYLARTTPNNPKIFTEWKSANY